MSEQRDRYGVIEHASKLIVRHGIMEGKLILAHTMYFVTVDV